MGLFATPIVFIFVNVYTDRLRIAGFIGGVLLRRIVQHRHLNDLRKQIEDEINNYTGDTDEKNPKTLKSMNLDADIMAEMRASLPKWVKFSEFERNHWLNHTLKEVWPQIQGIVRSSLEKTEETLAKKLPSPFVRVKFPNKELGGVPLQVTAIKALDTKAYEVILDLEVCWASMLEVSAVAWLTFLPLAFTVSDLQFSASIRVCLKELVSVIPCFQKMEVSLLEPLNFDIDLRLFGMDVFFVPGTHWLVNKMLNGVLTKYMWPERTVISMKKKTAKEGEIEKSYDGQLSISVRCAEGIRAADTNFVSKSTSDPFVQIVMIDQAGVVVRDIGTTRTIQKSLSPIWDETFVIVPKEGWANRTLKFRLYDRDKMTPSNDLLGEASIPLSQLFYEHVEVQEAQKDRSRKAVKDQEEKPVTVTRMIPTTEKKTYTETLLYKEAPGGKLTVDLHFSVFAGQGLENDIAQVGPQDNTDRAIAAPKNTRGVLKVSLISAANLKVMNRISGNTDPIVFFEFGSKKQIEKSRPVMNTCNPKWKDAVFFFSDVTPEEDTELRVEVKDYERLHKIGLKEHRSMGGFKVPLQDVIYSSTLVNDFHLDGTQGTVKLELSWTPFA